jgi:hypothetical protein
MTDKMTNRRVFVEKVSDADILREMITFAAEPLMEMEVAGLIGADYGEKSPGCQPSAMAIERAIRRRGGHS